MGKPYQSELKLFPTIHDWAAQENVFGLERFVDAAQSLPLCAVGSGGSLTAAAFATMLHRWTLLPSWYCTPYMMSYGPTGWGRATLLISAGGRNSEILHAQVKAGRPAGVICATSESPLVESAPSGTHIHATQLPTGRDGFLATNTLLATCVWLARAYGRRVSCLPEYDMVWPGLMEPGFGGIVRQAARAIAGKRYLLVLADEWGWPAAVDMESKFHESGLAAVQIADWRNFAHGRHHWLAVNGTETAVVALVTPWSTMLADRTLGILPEEILVARLEAPTDDAAGSLNLLVQAMHLVGEFGAARGVDPGKPKVAEFGRRIHHMDYPAPGS